MDMYDLTVFHPWGEDVYRKISFEHSPHIKDMFTIIFNETDRARGLILDLSDDKKPVKMQLDSPNCQIIFPYCRIYETSIMTETVGITFRYGTTN